MGAGFFRGDLLLRLSGSGRSIGVSLFGMARPPVLYDDKRECADTAHGVKTVKKNRGRPPPREIGATAGGYFVLAAIGTILPVAGAAAISSSPARDTARSEERRVGKECRSR